jgi:hypothetical protein
MIMKRYPSRILTETWLFLACSNYSEYIEAKANVLDNIIEVFGCVEVAVIHLESFGTDTYPKTA